MCIHFVVSKYSPCFIKTKNPAVYAAGQATQLKPDDYIWFNMPYRLFIGDFRFEQLIGSIYELYFHRNYYQQYANYCNNYQHQTDCLNPYCIASDCP